MEKGIEAKNSPLCHNECWAWNYGSKRCSVCEYHEDGKEAPPYRAEMIKLMEVRRSEK